MGSTLRHLRQHRWQRRVTTVSLAGIVAILCAWGLYPHIRNTRAIDALADPDPARRAKAVATALTLAAKHESFVEYLNDALDDVDDDQFMVIVRVLRERKLFYVDSRSAAQRQRFWRVDFTYHQPGRVGAATASAPVDAEDRYAGIRRLLIRRQFTFDERTGDDTGKLLAVAVDDPAPSVRSAATPMAAAHGDEGFVKALLGDRDPAVAARMIDCLALTGQGSLAGTIAKRLGESSDPAEIGSAAYALVALKYAGVGKLIADRIDQAKPGPVRDRLLYAASLLPAEQVGPAVVRACQPGPGDGGRMDRTMAFAAAGALRLAAAGPAVRDALVVKEPATAAGRQTELAAAARAARRLDLPVGRQIDELIRATFSPGTSLAMIEAIQTLCHAAQLSQRSDRPDRLSRDRAIETLLACVEQLSGSRAAEMPAAAGAVAVWALDPERGAEAIVDVARADALDAADWMAWHLVQRDPGKAGKIAESLFATRFCSNAKSAGAVMLALAARRSGQTDATLAMLQERFGPADDPLRRHPVSLGSLRCGLLLLGRTEQLNPCEVLLGESHFPQRRLLMALLLAGSEKAMESTLGSAFYGPTDLSYLLGNKLFAEVLAAACPDLPVYTLLAPQGVRLWQARLIRDAYMLGRAGARKTR